MSTSSEPSGSNSAPAGSATSQVLETPAAGGTDMRRLLTLSLASLGVVYGDIGTSPLYTVRECFHGSHGVAVSIPNVLGVVSLIFWALVLIISIKYLGFILRADNRGEGGILALAALVTPVKASNRSRRNLILTLGLFGASLLYADGIITPSITSLSAVEGLSIAAPELANYVQPITITILVPLFLFQSRGTARVGSVFGPVLLFWFVVLAVLGIGNIVQAPGVLRAISPHYAVSFLVHNGWHAFVTLGTVFLCVTGGEALYADVGHFGKSPIRLTWFSLVFPALLLNYFGQGAFLLGHGPDAINPFYQMAPSWALLPLVILATAAAVIASQAVITGAYSLTLQAIQLGYFPRLTIRHTSPQQIGQIYVPAVNGALMATCIATVLTFGSSGNLAAAYGMSIVLTMVITSILFFVLVRRRWNWSLPWAVGVTAVFLTVDITFLSANVTKIAYGGWFPLAVGALVFISMTTWQRGRQVLASRLRHNLIPLELFLADLLSDPPTRVPGTAVFMAGNPIGTPSALRHNFVHNKVLHERVVIVTVETAETPHAPVEERYEVEEIGEGFWRVMIRYGFMEEPHIPRELGALQHSQLSLDMANITYFLGRETLLLTGEPTMAQWRERLFAWLSRNAQTATEFFNLPPDRVFEVGVPVEL